ncbi:hypothetical protein KIW84_012288 [Lathyrus oleraceus]|uniref:Uncharacterized protein n=1 Tax=Pisum sativum TaxID=3888 RepID=A0A9D5BHD0_PEA|nr:hypothetical protein KIW84_012288 [Pisum sativum]
MTYAELYPSLVLKNLLQPRNPPQIPEPLPWWYKPELHCAFHQGTPRHDIENCYPLKYEVQKLVKNTMVSFEDRAPNVKANSGEISGFLAPLTAIASDLYPCDEIRRHKTRYLSEHNYPQPIGQPSYEDSDSHIQMRYVPLQCSQFVWCPTSRITDSGIHRYGTRRNQQRVMESLQAELAEMKIRMNQFMDLVQGVAQGQQELRLLVQRDPPITQPETLADPPAGEANGPNGPGPIPTLHVNLDQQPIQDGQDDQFPLLQEDFGMDPMFRRLEERLKAVEG